jgi:multidrug resistance efflux pump
MKLAELRLDRLTALYQRGAVSKLQLQQAQAELANARAAHAAAVANSRNDSPKKKP